jgi:hypothetical protein
MPHLQPVSLDTGLHGLSKVLQTADEAISAAGRDNPGWKVADEGTETCREDEERHIWVINLIKQIKRRKNFRAVKAHPWTSVFH